MGLDITAYSHLRHLGHCADAEEDDHSYDPVTLDVRHVEGYTYDAFPHALRGIAEEHIKIKRGYRDESQFLSVGCFGLTSATERFSFRAGSYGGYNAFRRDLAAMFNPFGPKVATGSLIMPMADSSPDPAKPFFELIWFADNEGTLLADVAAKLAREFEQHRGQWIERYGDGDRPNDHYWVQHWDNWTDACNLAAQDGLIDFH